MLDDQSDFCFDNEARQWPPISLMRRLVLAFLHYINHPTLYQMLTNNENIHLNSKVHYSMNYLSNDENYDNNIYILYY
jgi:hypothetical protein